MINMKEFDYRYLSPMAEQPDVQFSSTGLRGGDAGHGGHAILFFNMYGGYGFDVRFKDENGNDREINTQRVSVAVSGDWELSGMAIAFLELGRALLARDDVLKTRSRWVEENEIED